MPQVYSLEEYNPVLKDVALIVGDGLCSNIYVIGSKNVTLIDTGVGNRMNPIFPQLEDLSFKPEDIKQVVLTHAHHDHAMGAFLILDRVSPRILVHEADTKYIATSFGDALVKLQEGDIVKTEIGSFDVYLTPGHTPGCICLHDKNTRILISGDTVFPDGYYGRYDGESGSLDAMIESLRRLSELNCDVMLPGHGSPVFTDANNHVKKSYEQASRPRY
jgi:glyoxylase-like metal-dependent hydrolase (beta-lactamase superfamily II)